MQTQSIHSLVRWGLGTAIVGLLGCAGGGTPAGDVVGDVLVGAAIDSASTRVEDLVEQAGDRADESLLRAAHAAELMIAQLEVAYAESLDQTLDTLDKAERDSLERALQLVQELEQSFGGSLEQIATIEQNLSATARLLPFAKTDPIVLRWGPQVLLASAGGLPPTLTLEGRNLGAGEPFAVFAGRRLAPTEKIDDRLTFQIPGPPLVAQAFQPMTFQVRTFKRTKKLLFFASLESRDYRVTVLPVPSVLGQLTIYGKQDVSTSTPEERRTSEIRCYAPHCRRDSESERVTIAEQNVSLDPGSVKWHTTYDRSGDARVKDISPNGFTVKLSCKSYGCGPGWSGTRGQIKGYATYRVVRTAQKVEEVLLTEDQELRWDAPFRLNTPEGIRTVSVKLETIFDDEELLGPGGRGRYFEVDFDRTGRELIVRPRSLQQALQPPRS